MSRLMKHERRRQCGRGKNLLSFMTVAIGFMLAPEWVNAAVTPLGPGPGEVFREGGRCTTSWTRDTTGTWSSFAIDLMSGSNTQMTVVTRVAEDMDGTSTSSTTFTFECPAVTPNSAIYFLQFTQDDADPQWTTRFTIASADGSTTPPTNRLQPGGQAIPWGSGMLADGTVASTVGPGGLSSSSTRSSSSLTTTSRALTSLTTTSSITATSTAIATTSSTISFASQASTRSNTMASSSSSASASVSAKPKSATAASQGSMFYDSWPLAGKIGLLAGVIVGGLIILGLLIWLIVRLCHRRSRHQDHRDALLGNSQSTSTGLLGTSNRNKNNAKQDDDAFDFRDDGDSMYKQPIHSNNPHQTLQHVNESTTSFGRYADDFDEKYSTTPLPEVLNSNHYNDSPYNVAATSGMIVGTNRAGVGSRNGVSNSPIHSPTHMFFNNNNNNNHHNQTNQSIESYQMIPTRSQSPLHHHPHHQQQQQGANEMIKGYSDLVPQIRVNSPARFNRDSDNVSMNSNGTGTGSVNYDWSNSKERQRGQADWLASKK
ncbi:hypothetical protein OIO90_002809 [Microbotryomycetes sp. JL221]|nr:hypothetical protein OIO90_002809 [Microbotryomycetes sp. JL221]